MPGKEADVSIIYEWIGRAVVGLVRWRYGRQLRIAAAVAVGALGAAALVAWASGDDDEES